MATPTNPGPLRRRMVLGTVALLGSGAPHARSSGAADLRLEIDLPARRYLRRELMRVRLTLHNDGPAPVSVPRIADTGHDALVLSVEGPSFASPWTFTPRSITAARGATSPRAPGMQTLAAGANAQVLLDISRGVPFSVAGSHVLRARLAWDGGNVEATAVTFEMALPTLRSARLMLDDGFQRPVPIRVLCVADDGRERLLLMAFFREKAPDYAGTELSYLLRVGPVDPTVDEALATWTNYPRGDLFVQRYGWRSPARFGIASTNPDDQTSVASERALGVQPALVDAGGRVDVFQFGADQRLALWRFATPVRGGPAQPPQALWHLPLEGVEAARAARASAPRDSPPVAVLVARTAAGAALTLVESVDGRPTTRRAELRSARLLPNSEPALRVDDQGRIHAALVVAEDNALRRLYCVRVTWPARAGDGRAVRAPAILVDATPLAASAAFDVSPGSAQEDWIALLPDRRLLRGGAGVAESADGAPLLPLQMLVLGEHRYLLVQDAAGTPALETLG